MLCDIKTIYLPINTNHLETTPGRDECAQLLCNTASFPYRGASCSEQPPLENYGQTEHEGKARPGPGEDSMTVWQDVLSYTLCVPARAQTAQRGHTWKEEEEGAGCRTCCRCFVSTCLRVCLHESVWTPDARKRYIVSVFSLERLWYASKMPTAVTASSTKCISGKHTQMHANAHRLLPSHLRKTLQMCLGNCSNPGREGKALSFSFFFFVPNKQTATDFPTSLHQVMTPS